MSMTHGTATPAGTTDCGCNHAGTCDVPKALQRNVFFPRKLMEVRHWQAEQAYHRRSREIVTRLGLGSGVLCGLTLDPTDEGTLVLEHGVAVDGHGRLIVVPQDIEIDPTRLTDCCGRATDDRFDSGVVTVSLCHHECGSDLVAVPADSCEDEPRCVPSMVREAFAVTVTKGDTERVGLPDEACHALFGHSGGNDDDGHGVRDDGHPEGEKLRQLFDKIAPRSCACGEGCVPLGTLELREEVMFLDTAVRTVIRSNRQLLDLILCLAERVDECCQPPQTALPPRITDLWPQPDRGQALASFTETHRLELAFDRNMAEQGLDDPMAWLGIWVLDPQQGATRLALERAAASLDHVTVPPGGDGAAYTVDLEAGMVPRGACVVVMIRSTSPGPVRATGTDHLALDADLAATGLSADQREKLWGLEPLHTDSNYASFAADATNAAQVAFPTGNGTPGGQLHVVLRSPEQVVSPPQLLSVWPPGAAGWGRRRVEREEVEEWRSFLEQPRVELLVSRALSDEAITSPRAWLRVWNFSPDGNTLYSAQEIELAEVEAVEEDDDAVRYIFQMRQPEWMGPVFLVQLRSTPPLQQDSPVGRDDPAVLLDADFDGTKLDSQTRYRLWEGDLFPQGLPAFSQRTTLGEVLHDGTEGGLAHWGFFFPQP